MNKKILLLLWYFFVVARADRSYVSENGTELSQYSDMEWAPKYFYYEIDGKSYCYGQEFDDTWAIRELLPGGKLGEIKSKGSLRRMFYVQFPYKINGRQFFYAQSYNSTMWWFIKELLPDGKMGQQMDHGTWRQFYEVQFTYSIDGKQYLYGQSHRYLNWFIQELLPDGKMGEETSAGEWSDWNNVVFPYSIGGNHFFYGQTRDGGFKKKYAWFIRQLMPDGKMGDEWNAGVWGQYYGAQFPYEIDGKQYFYAQNWPSGQWFTRQLKAAGHMGSEQDAGVWNYFYKINFPFKVGTKQYFFRRKATGWCSNSNWVIQELLPGGRMGRQTDSGNWSEVPSTTSLQNTSSVIDPIEY